MLGKPRILSLFPNSFNKFNKTYTQVKSSMSLLLFQNYTVHRMFTTAEAFFKSLGLSEMPPLFWNRTIMVNPEGITMVCHASAWDFFDQEDFRCVFWRVEAI